MWSLYKLRKDKILNILLLTFFYPPDLSAGSFRANALAKELSKINEKIKVNVWTTSPNRYYDLAKNIKEEIPGYEKSVLSINRVSLNLKKFGIASQIGYFLKFAYGVWRGTKNEKIDIVVVTSGRLMSAILAYLIAKRAKAKLYVDVRDLFVDTISNIYNGILINIGIVIIRIVEAQILKRADKVNLISEGFLPYVRKIIPTKELSLYTNGIDEEFIDIYKKDTKSNPDLKLVLYAGNIGAGQGLHKIIPVLAKKMEGIAHFRIIGDGSKKDELVSQIKKVNARNIVIVGAVERAKLVEEYKNADILFLHLNDYDAFKKVLPSKIFEYGATGKPIVAGVTGFSKSFLEAEISNAEFFDPTNTDQAKDALNRAILNGIKIDPSNFCQKYSRKNIMKKMALDVLTLRTGEGNEVF